MLVACSVSSGRLPRCEPRLAHSNSSHANYGGRVLNGRLCRSRRTSGRSGPLVSSDPVRPHNKPPANFPLGCCMSVMTLWRKFPFFDASHTLTATITTVDSRQGHVCSRFVCHVVVRRCLLREVFSVLVVRHSTSPQGRDNLRRFPQRRNAPGTIGFAHSA